MPLPPDIQQRIAKAKANGFTDAQIQADLQRKYGETYSPAPAAPAKPQSWLDKASGISNKFLGALAGFTGMDKAGESLGRLGLQLGNQMGKATGTDMNKTFAVPKFSGKQLTGDVLTLAGTGLNLAAPGSGSLGRTVAANAGAAGLLGTGEGLNKGESTGEALTHGATKAAVAAAITGGVGLLGKLIGSLTKKAPQAIYKASTRVPNETDAGLLLEKGITGSREQLAAKAADAMAKSEAAIQASPALGDAVDYSTVLADPGVTKVGTQAGIVGKSRTFDRVLSDVLPQAKTSIPDLQASVEELAAKASETGTPMDMQAFHDAFQALQDLKGRPEATRAGALAVKRAIDANTPNAAFAGTATAIEAKTKNAIANALRKMVSEDAPDIASGLKDEQAIINLQDALEAYARSKTSPVPYSAGNLLQRTILTPALGTRMAKGGYEVGKALTGAQGNFIIQALKRMGRVGAVNALGRF